MAYSAAGYPLPSTDRSAFTTIKRFSTMRERDGSYGARGMNGRPCVPGRHPGRLSGVRRSTVKTFRGVAMARCVVSLVVFILVAACATELDKGGEAFNRGQYAVAIQHWEPTARKGDPRAQFNLGIMWQHGLGVHRNVNEAATWFHRSANQDYSPAMVAMARIHQEAGFANVAESWLTLAARWNDQEAVSALRALGRPVPRADLYAARELRRTDEEQAAAAALYQLGYVLGCAAVGGCPTASTPALLYSPRPAAAGAKTQPAIGACRSDFDCGAGQMCAKAYLSSDGVCRPTPGDRLALPSSDSTGPNYNSRSQCIADADCFPNRCDLKARVCVGR